MRYSVPCSDAEFACSAGDHLEHRAYRAIRRDPRFGKRDRVLGDLRYAAITVNEDHIQRDIGVPHPEFTNALIAEVEEHPLSLRQFAPEHESPCLVLRRECQFDCEDVHTILAGNLKRLKLGCIQIRATAEEYED